MGKTNDLADWIISELETISDMTGNIYKYVVENPDNWPATTVVFNGNNEAEMASLRTTWRTYQFAVRIMYEIASQSLTLQGIDEKLYDLQDQVVDKFELLRDVGGNALLLDVTTSVADWLDSGAEIRYVDVILPIKDLRTAA